jgi:nitroimidazol reductase NimA-like FMN-containing flavoprotein (pyridoxamine 5'-phosphate oxidase superfamily)
MAGPRADRPFMPGYGIASSDEGLLPWAWAEERLVGSRNYWVASVRPGGRPHVMPVWGVWANAELTFSSSLGSRKVRNLHADPRCTVTTEDAARPVVLDGEASIVTDLEQIAGFLTAMNGKYETSYGLDFLDPEVNATVAVRPYWAFALDDDAFNTSPTRWTFTG